jgi:protein gp37
MRMAARIEAMFEGTKGATHYRGTTKKVNGNAVWTGKVVLAPENIFTAPMRRKKPTVYFVNSMGDLFHEAITDEQIDGVFAVMALCPQHTFQVLTKRAERMRDYMSTPYRHDEIGDQMIEIGDIQPGFKCVRWPFPNVWLGVSCERQQEADERIPLLLQTPAAIRFISAEPLLGPIDLFAMPFSSGDPRHHWDALTGQALMYGEGVNGNPDITVRIEKPIYQKLDWVIAGGESGPHARAPMIGWIRSLRDQCAAAGVPYFFKQWGAHAPDDPNAYHTAMRRVGKKAAGRLLDGVEHNGFPTTPV